MTKTKRRGRASGEGIIAPPDERWRRGEVEKLPQTIADDDGRPAAPFRAIDTLMAMERRGSITAEMHQAGRRFRDDFALAAFDPLRAADILRLSGGAGARPLPAGFGQDAARDRVWKALLVLGGHASPAGACVWHVLGIGITIKEWAIRETWGGGRHLRRDTASGILIGALCSLQKHYGL